jgi:hypothetical protein
MTKHDEKANDADRFEQATADLIVERRFGGPAHGSTEEEIMDETVSLVREATAANRLRYAISKAMPRIREMGCEEIAKTQANGAVSPCILRARRHLAARPRPHPASHKRHKVMTFEPKIHHFVTLDMT